MLKILYIFFIYTAHMYARRESIDYIPKKFQTFIAVNQINNGEMKIAFAELYADRAVGTVTAAVGGFVNLIAPSTQFASHPECVLA